jgi:hypothetical protein
MEERWWVSGDQIEYSYQAAVEAGRSEPHRIVLFATPAQAMRLPVTVMRDWKLAKAWILRGLTPAAKK